MINPWYQTLQGQAVATPGTPPQNIPYKFDIKGSDGNVFNPSNILEEGPGAKTSREVSDYRTKIIGVRKLKAVVQNEKQWI